MMTEIKDDRRFDPLAPLDDILPVRKIARVGNLVRHWLKGSFGLMLCDYCMMYLGTDEMGQMCFIGPHGVVNWSMSQVDDLVRNRQLYVVSTLDDAIG